MASTEVDIPTINIASLLATSGESFSDEDRAATANALLRACETHGLFFVVGHGITTSQRRLAFDNARRFFALPEAAKRKIPARKGGFTRGYIGFGGESGSHLRECKEAFSYGYPWPNDQPPNNALQGPNIWPDSDSLGEGWRDSMSALFRLMVSVNEAVARGLSLSLDLGLQDLPALCRGGDTISLLRLFHYFPYSNDAASNSGSGSSSSSSSSGTGSDNGKNDNVGSAKAVASAASSTGGESCGNDGTGNSGGSSSSSSSSSREGSGAGNIGSSPHTDWGLSTSILQDGAGGLQFLEKETQRWVDVPCAQEDALVFNCGDYLSLLSNDRLKSPVHQVVTTGVERTSFVFFYYPSFDAKLPVTAPQDASSIAGATSTNAAAAAVVTATAAAAEEPVAREPQATIGPYNTLLDLRNKQGGGDEAAAAVGEDDASFGQYLARKWGAVFRET